jgi:hypothetical protein
MQPTNKKQKYLYNQDISQFLITECDKTLPIRNEQPKKTNDLHTSNHNISFYSITINIR